MCTAATYQTKDFYFGRTLDNDFSYGDEIVVTPRNYPLLFRHMDRIDQHYAMIGMACVRADYPLYYDAVNEKGLGIAGLNFVGNAVYQDLVQDKNNVAQFELILWLLGTCATVKEAQIALENVNLVNTPFSDQLPVAQLHWIVADHSKTITVEATKQGLQIYDNPIGILTNNPPFPEQLFRLNDYMKLSAKEPHNEFSDQVVLQPYSRGMGAIGLPGDLSSQSRFVRAAFVKLHSVSGNSEKESVNQFFHILGAVDQQRGCCDLEDGNYETTLYTSCCNTKKGIYYYTTYENHQITAVNMYHENLDATMLVRYHSIREEQFHIQNETLQ